MGLRLPSQLSPLRTIKLTDISVQFGIRVNAIGTDVTQALVLQLRNCTTIIHCVGFGEFARDDKSRHKSVPNILELLDIIITGCLRKII